MANAYRNAPIQGGVADVMLDAYARLHEVLAEFPTAVAVQTVHDSVVIECDDADAPAVAAVVKRTLEGSDVSLVPRRPRRRGHRHSHQPVRDLHCCRGLRVRVF